jgi:glycosyltransferase involved in cell wall biosynthesis
MKLGIVIPCYNEEEVLPETSRRIIALIDRLVALGKIADDSQVFFVDDGSKDRTWALIEGLASTSRRVVGIKLSRNRGHQNALIAGLFNAEGDALVSVDADLQDDLDAIEKMIERFRAGIEIVYGVRKRRETDTTFKRATAEAFYRLIAALGAESVHNHADYRLMSRRAVECLKQYAEVEFVPARNRAADRVQSEVVYYDRVSRFAGESKYPLKKMVSLALDAITSLSVVPLRLITLAGSIIFVVSMLITLWALWVRLFTTAAVPGWTSVVLPMYFLGGIQILCIGILGEYLGKTYVEVKARPRYFIEATVSAAPTERATDDRLCAPSTSGS